PWLRDPRRLLDDGPLPDASRDAERLVAFFDVRYVVLHRRYLEPRVFDALDRFVADQFPHVDRWADEEVVAYEVRARPTTGLWPRDDQVDFGANRAFVLLTGWHGHERIGRPDIQPA